jgi:Flp pilus assembly protein TadG
MTRTISSRRHIQALVNATNGGAAIEFALIAPIFVAFMISILEAPAIIFSNMALNRMTNDVSMAVRADPGRLLSASDVRTIACGASSILINCAATKLDIQIVPLGSSIPAGSTYQRSTTVGIPDQIVLRYRWNSFLPISAIGLSSADEGALKSVSIVHPDPIRSPCPVSGGVIWC